MNKQEYDEFNENVRTLIKYIDYAISRNDEFQSDRIYQIKIKFSKSKDGDFNFFSQEMVLSSLNEGEKNE